MSSFQPARLPANETARLSAVRRSGLMDTENRSRFDIYTRLIREIAGVPISYTGLIDEARQYFLSENFTGCLQGATEVARNDTICQYALLDTRPLVIEDLRRSAVFRDHPLVTGDPHWVFWAGFPLVTPEGLVLGSLCAVDFEPRILTPHQTELMRGIAEEMAVSIRLQTDQQEAIAEKARAVLSGLSAAGVDTLAGASDFLGLCLEKPLRTVAEDLLSAGLVETGPDGILLSAKGRALKTAEGLGPASFRIRPSPLRDAGLLDEMFGLLEG